FFQSLHKDLIFVPVRTVTLPIPTRKFVTSSTTASKETPPKIICPTGLHFDEYSGTCVWPESAGRIGCGEPEGMTLKDGFTCPKESKSSSSGQSVAHPVYAHPTDCQKFYVCLNGVTPREQGCQVGEVYNEESQKCDAPENVPGCENWFPEEPAAAPPSNKKPAKKIRRRRMITKN
ncbi:hypothetical protein WDU94_009486, partial [Cyamophila willieti]